MIGTPSDKQREIFDDRARRARRRHQHGASRPSRPSRRFTAGKWTRRCASSSPARATGKYFIHRTGHSIGRDIHANGANLDNLETKDDREILPNTCFSVEPGIYLPEFGVRSEINMMIRNGKGEVTGRIQNELVLI